MPNVLIVDDEVFICALVKNLINWEELGLEFLGEVYNGEDAIKIIKEQRPDIVITDIRMPKIGGLELMRLANEIPDYQTHFIIISGHKQFDYAYEAIKYGAVDFLLKPINQIELNDTLKRLVSKNRTQNLSTPEDKNTHKDIMRKQLIINLYHNVVEKKELTTGNINSKYSYHFKDDNFLIGIIRVDKYERLANLHNSISEKTNKRITDSFGGLCHDVGQNYRNGNHIFILNYSQENREEIKQHMQNLLEDIETSLRSYRFLEVTIGLGSESDISGIFSGVKQAEKAVLCRAVLGTGRVIDYSQLDQGEFEPEINSYNSQFNQAADLLDKAELFSACNNFLESLIISCEKMPYYVIPMVTRRTQAAVMEAVSIHIKDLTAKYAEKTAELTFGDCSNKGEVLARMQKTISTAFDEIVEIKDRKDSKIISTVKDYIVENISRQVSLDEVSKEVYLSANYLGVLFKKETGMLFSQYITQVKIEKAKELLREMDYSIKEIADKLGYKDIRNFSRLFQNQVGVKPSEYRKIYRMD